MNNELANLILFGLLVSGICTGIYSTVQPGMALGFVLRYYLIWTYSLSWILFPSASAFAEMSTRFNKWGNRVSLRNDKPFAFMLRFFNAVAKPLFSCLICMSSFWTIAIWWICHKFGLIGPLHWIVLLEILFVAGVNAVIVQFFPEEDQPDEQHSSN